MSVELKIPEVGESITEVQIGEWLKSKGDRADQDEPLVVIETDKVTVELPAPVAGKITKVLKSEGDTAEIGEVIGYMEEGAAEDGGGDAPADGEGEDDGEAEEEASKKKEKKTTSKKKKKAKRKTKAKAAAGKGGDSDEEDDAEAEDEESEPEEAAEAEAESSEDGAEESGGDGAPDVFIMPAARRALAEHDLDPSEVEATGPGGRMLKEDVQRAVGDAGEKRRAPAAEGAPADDTEEEVVPMSPMRKRIAERLVEAQQTAALLTTFNEIDMSAVIALREEHQERFVEKHDVKLGFMSFFVKASIEALKEIPAVNAEVRGTDIVYRNAFHVGIAVGGGKGLVVPVVRHAERLGFAEIERTIGDLAKRAQESKLTLDELQGGTFTISNGGIYGSLLSTPIVNPPQSGILGLHAIQDRPVAIDGQVVVRPMMYVALTYDHRVVDGREAVTFLKRVKECVEDPARILLEA